jgi:antitoxin HigA-1
MLAMGGITAAQLARDIKFPANRVTGILHFTRAITADTALRLGRYFGTSPEFWMNLQQIYELRPRTVSGVKTIFNGPAWS